MTKKDVKNVVVIGAGWGGLSVAHHLLFQNKNKNLNVTLIDAAPRVGGVVRDGYTTKVKKRKNAEAGQHGFWDNYYNIFNFLETELQPYIDQSSSSTKADDILTSYAEQGQYSPRGLEAIWPVYREMEPKLPTGIAQFVYTKFMNLPITDRLTALPLVLAFSEFDDSPQAWAKYDDLSFRDLCTKLGVSQRMYDEAFEPMILTGLFAPGRECSAAAALGMAYFFVLKSQTSFDVRWCRGNIGEKIFDPWIDMMKSQQQSKNNNNTFQLLTGMRADDFEIQNGIIQSVTCTSSSSNKVTFPVDDVVFAVGATALSSIVRNCPSLASYPDLAKFTNLRGTSVLATRLYLDRKVHIPYSANAVFGFDKNVGQTFFDISTLHGAETTSGSVIEVDYYHANQLLALSDDEIIEKVKSDLVTMLSSSSSSIYDAKVIDAAIVRLPQAVNWYFPGSYDSMPDAKSNSISNLYFVGDIVRSRHGSWSQEKAFVTGMETANLILNNNDPSKQYDGIIPLSPDEPHVSFGRQIISTFQQVMNVNNKNNDGKMNNIVSSIFKPPSLSDFLR